MLRVTDDAEPITTVWLVPHTHWDREWYEPFQRFRLRLVDLMDDVVDRALAEPEFRFTMDGQMAAVDDYLEVRPERTEAIRRLVAHGQLAIGPWRVLMDEFLCSGETMIRNLEIGLADAARLGPSMPVGYLPDMFGHCAQMPQLLLGVGIERACVWRGVPAGVKRSEFAWRSPDGSTIRTEYLANSYGNAADLFADTEGTAGRLLARIRTQSQWYAAGGFLAMYGTDHAAPLPGLLDQVAALNASDGPEVRVATLTEYLDAIPAPVDSPVVPGELRSHARANILPGVLSVRWPLKEAMAVSERLLARYAEPLAALVLREVPQGYLDLAWRRVVDASCHDSVTGCGVDETALQVQARLEEAGHLAQAVRDRALDLLAQASPAGSVVVVNPLPTPRDDLIELTLPVPSQWPAVELVSSTGQVVTTQELSRPEPVLARETVASADLQRLIHRIHDRELFGLQLTGVDIDADERRVTFALAEAGDPGFDSVATGDRLAQAAARHTPQAPWEVVTRAAPTRTLAAKVPVPALGWASFQVRPGQAVAEPSNAASPLVPGGSVLPILCADRTLDNGLIRVEVHDDGTFSVRGADGSFATGLGRIVDGGDCGDTYNYGPPGVDALVTTPLSVTVESGGSRGPVLGRLTVTRGYALPATSDHGGRSAEVVATPVVLHLEVRVDEPFVRVAVSWENRTRDHRLRLHLPTPRTASGSHAQGQLAVVSRSRHPESGPVGEYPLATFPAERFIDAGGLGAILTRTTEYEITDGPDGTEIALTLLRAVGWLSRNVHPHRNEPAGPQLPTPAAHVIGPGSLNLAVLPHDGSWAQAGLGRWAESMLHPVVVLRGGASEGSETDSVEGLTIDGKEVDLLSLRRREDGWLQVRVVNSCDEPDTLRLSSAVRPVLAAVRCDLLGRHGEVLDVIDEGAVLVPVRPWEIATIALDVGAAPLLERQ